MLHRSVSITVMVGFVIGQMAAFPHAHAEGDRLADHNFRPHIHVTSLAHGSHSHDGEHRHHHNADGSHSHSPKPVSDQDQHDSDAVYLPHDIGVSLPTKTLAPVHNFEVIVALAIPVAPSATSDSDYTTGPFFSSKRSPGRPLYLALRALRI